MTGRFRNLAALLPFIASVFTSGYGPPTLVEADPANAAISPSVLSQIQESRPPEIGAKSAILMDAATGSVIYERESHTRRAMASTTKIMTALVTLSSARLDETVTASPNVRSVEPTIIGLDPGDQLTVVQLLYGLLLPSGNDAAVALAEHVGGSVAGFARMMNAKAADLDMEDTHFVNPHGLDEDGHYSSAYDLAILARAAMKQPVFESIVSTREFRIKGPPAWLFRSSNLLLQTVAGADGIKTGYTDNAGRCLVASAARGGRRAISVVLDSETQWADSAALLQYFFATYDWEMPPRAQSALASYTAGQEVRTASARTLPQMVLPRWQEPYLRWYYDVPSGTDPDDGAVGTVSYFLFGTKVGQAELYAGGG